MSRPARLTHTPDLGLQGQVALVTGATSGIGRACALALGQAGVAVGVNHRPGSEEAAAEVVQAIEKAGGQALDVPADVSREDQVAEAVEHLEARLGPLHILVANAGIQDGAPFADMSFAQWRRVIDVNLHGQFLCAREAVRAFLRRGMQEQVSCALGKVIFMSSVHQTIPWACEANYAASKGGIMLLMQSLAQELAHQRIRVNAVAPGAIRTRINREAWESEQAMNDLLELIPYGRIGEPEDVAQAVSWLASDLSDYVVGTTLFTDGGMTLYPAFRGGG